MTANDGPERRLARHYAAEAPSRAPDWVLARTLAAIDSTPQRPAPLRVPRRLRDMNMIARLAAAAVVAIALGGAGLVLLSSGGSGVGGTPASPPPTPSPAASSSPASSVSPTPVPTDASGAALVFRHRFDYVFAGGAGWDLGPTGPSEIEFRIPSSGEDGFSAVGVIVRAITGGRGDPCSESSAEVALPGGPEAVTAYLKTIPTIEVRDESTLMIDGRPAVQAFVTLTDATTDCPDVRPFTSADEAAPRSEVISDVRRGQATRLAVVDVGGEHVLIWTYLTVDDVAWYSVADELIESFRFEPDVVSPSGSLPPALTETYVSAIHGLSVSYPAGWHLQPATETWNGDIVFQGSAFADVIYEKDSDTPFIALASRPLAIPASDWAAQYLDTWNLGCGGFELITVDGVFGVLPAGCPVAFVATGGRGYFIWLYRVDDLDWFREILATVRLSPEAAVEPAPSG